MTPPECACKPWQRCREHEAASVLEAEQLHTRAQDDYYRTQRHDPERVRFKQPPGAAEGLV